MNAETTIAIIGTIITSVLITAGQVFWKLGISNAGGFYINDQNILDNIIRILINPQVILGFIVYIFATVIFMYLLSNYEVSFIIPISSVSYVFALLAGKYIFSEIISNTNIIGVLLIMIGVALISAK